MSKIITFSDFQNETKFDFWDDSMSIDKVMIEAHICPKCGKSLAYIGRSKVTEYRAYGVCAKDNYAKLFWIEKAETFSLKKMICEAVQAANG